MLKSILFFLMIVPTMALAQSHDVRERRDVIKIFSLVLPKMDVKKGDGIGSDLDCIFALKWDESFRRDANGEPTRSFDPHEKLTIQQALDPKRHHPEMFCDYAERNARAQRQSQDLNKTVAVASVGFSYPYFEHDGKVATIYYQRWSQLFLAGRMKILPVGSNGVIPLRRFKDTWSFRLVTTGISN